MYNNGPYDEYMRTVLGYTPNCMQDDFLTNDYYIMQANNRMIDDLYPDMYKKVYPLVCKECSTNNIPVTREILEQMTDSVLNQIEIDLKIQTNVKIETRKEETKNVTQKLQSSNSRQRDINSEEMNREDRNARNNILRDLIKILILRELLDSGRFPNRPPHFKPSPPRPPMPGPRPPFQGGLGGIMPRDF